MNLHDENKQTIIFVLEKDLHRKLSDEEKLIINYTYEKTLFISKAQFLEAMKQVYNKQSK